MSKIYIPFMSEKEIREISKTIKPIVRIKDKYFLLRELTDTELFNISLNWIEKDLTDTEIDITTLSPIMDIDMLHKYFIGGPIAPTIAEIIAQIPKKILHQVVAVEIVKSTENIDDFMFHLKEFYAGYHVCTIKLYVIKRNEII